MTRNVIIILVSAGIVAWSLYVFKKRAIFSWPIKTIALLIFILWLFTTFLPNLPIILSPLSPLVKGKVLDASTSRQIANCYIESFWETESITPAGGHIGPYNSYFTKTNEKGEFQIPRHPKSLTVYGVTFPIIASRYNGLKIIAYSHGYKNTLIPMVDSTKKELSDFIIHMEPIEKPIDFFKNVLDLRSKLEIQDFFIKGLTVSEKQYFFDDFYIYDNQFGSSFVAESTKDNETILYALVSIYKEVSDPKQAAIIMQKLVKIFPNNSRIVEHEINKLINVNK